VGYDLPSEAEEFGSDPESDLSSNFGLGDLFGFRGGSNWL